MAERHSLFVRRRGKHDDLVVSATNTLSDPTIATLLSPAVALSDLVLLPKMSSLREPTNCQLQSGLTSGSLTPRSLTKGNPMFSFSPKQAFQAREVFALPPQSDCKSPSSPHLGYKSVVEQTVALRFQRSASISTSIDSLSSPSAGRKNNVEVHSKYKANQAHWISPPIEPTLETVARNQQGEFPFSIPRAVSKEDKKSSIDEAKETKQTSPGEATQAARAGNRGKLSKMHIMPITDPAMRPRPASKSRPARAGIMDEDDSAGIEEQELPTRHERHLVFYKRAAHAPPSDKKGFMVAGSKESYPNDVLEECGTGVRLMDIMTPIEIEALERAERRRKEREDRLTRRKDKLFW